MRASDIESAWQDWEEWECITEGIDPLLIEDTHDAMVALMSRRTPEQAEESVREMWEALGIGRETSAAFWNGVEEMSKRYRPNVEGASATFAFAGLCVGLMAAHKAGEYEPSGKA